jgi:hypothetical protein
MWPDVVENQAVVPSIGIVHSAIAGHIIFCIVNILRFAITEQNSVVDNFASA